ncbi:MAG: hypothetical protein JOZ69_13230 [Myxococcales bacterium]|nr:hypothetical protein [Myxococcales bacterium]
MRVVLVSSVLGLLAAAGATGCTAVVDVERFHQAALTSADGGKDAGGGEAGVTPGTTTNTDLRVTFLGMKPHLTQLTEFRVVDENNIIQARAEINPLAFLDSTIFMPAAVPPSSGAYHFDFWADMTGMGHYTGIGSVLTNDHAWRIDPLADSDGVTHVDGLIQVVFTHNTSFTDIDRWPSDNPTANPSKPIGGDAVINVTNATDVEWDLIQVRVVDKTTGHSVGLFRVPQISAPAFTMTIPGVAEPAADFDVLVYVDSNGNTTYDDPSATTPGPSGQDLGWRLSGTADATGLLNVTADLSQTASGKVDVGSPW